MAAPFATRTTLEAYLKGSDYADQIPTEEEELGRVLDRAFEVILDNTIGMLSFDDDGNPLDGDDVDGAMATVLGNAVCAQVEQWFEIGEDNDITGLPRETFASFGVSVNRLPSILAPRAARILRLAGVLGENPPTEAPITVSLV